MINSVNRSKTVLLTIGLCYFLVTAKFFYTQIVRYTSQSNFLTSQSYKTTTVKPESGSILSSDGSTLLTFQTVYKVSLYKPDLTTQLELLPQVLTTINPDINPADLDKIDKFITNIKLKWINLSSIFTQEQINNLHDPGIVSEKYNQPVYPEDSIGKLFLNEHSLQSHYKRELFGKVGFSWESKDAVGQTVLSHPSWIIDPINGQNISTQVNRQIQYLVEDTLSQGIHNFSADSGEILILNPQSGGIIAMSALTASASSESSNSATYFNNPIISNLFEPGSIIKPLIMAAALDSGSIDSNYICQKCDRPIQIGGYSISNWDSSFHPQTDLRDIIKNSDNIGMSYIMESMGYDRFIKYFNLLGFDKKTNIDLPNETRPIVKTYWPEIDLATASFGQGFAVTQIQMLTAFNTLANQGQRVSPHFNNNYPLQTVKIYQPETVEAVNHILQYSVENGAVAKFKPANLEVCGKSGTSQVAVKGGYSDTSTIASYIGFSPCQNPLFTMIVTIHNPRTSPWGSSTAAPIWYELASKIPSLL
ncbi:MAG: penicillin-binding protein 2 [Microgenomates group bacterium]